MIGPTTFSVENYDEAERVDGEWRSLAARVDALVAKLPEDEKASYFELVQYPVDACANLTEMYIAAGRNAVYAKQGRMSANAYAAETRKYFAKDAALTNEYNHGLLDGKWNHMMDQTHIGYTFWNEPPLNAMPAVTEVQPALVAGAGVAGTLGEFDSVAQQTRRLTLFDRGVTPVEFKVVASDPWIVVDKSEGTVASEDVEVKVGVDWAKAPAGVAEGSVVVMQAGAAPMRVAVKARRIEGVTREDARGFVESDGYVAIEAADSTARTASGEVHWEELPGFGETRSAMTVMPVTAASDLASSAGMEYGMYLYDAGSFTMEAVLSPSMGFVAGRGLRFAVSVDDGPRTVVDALEHNTREDWERAVSDGVRRVSVPLTIASPGYHTLKVWMVDPGVVLERVVVSHGPLLPSYLGPPESFHRGTAEARP